MPGRIPGGGMPGRGGPPGKPPGGGMPGLKGGGGPDMGGLTPGCANCGGGMPGRGGPPAAGAGPGPGPAAGGGRMMGAACTCGLGSIIPGAGPPTPLAGPASPAGACPGTAAGMPLPAARPMPGPPGATCALDALESSAGGGPSIVRATTSSPRSKTSPNTLRSSLSSSDFPFLGGSLRNSSESPRTRFICLSNAMNLPTICLPSVTVTRIR
jgi:hypothetical protein